MEFDWDDANTRHIALHKVIPEEAEQVIRNRPFDIPAVYRSGEVRTANLGETDTGRVLFVVITERDGLYRVVTARDAHKTERAFYSKQKAISHDQDPTDP